VVIAVERSTRGKNCWMSWIMGRDDGAEWVCYTDFSANPRFSYSRVELPLPTHMRCQSMADRTPLLAQEETLLDLTAPVRALLAYLHNHSQGRRSRSASTPSTSNLLARGPLLCTRTRLQKRAESATGRTLSLASADMLVQIHSDLRLRFAAFPPARRAITVPPPLQG
jgi:hypothetical protein